MPFKLLFGEVSDYPGMLNRIAFGTFLFSLLYVWLLRINFPAFDKLLAPYTPTVPVLGGLAVPLPTFAIALAVAFLSRISKLHDRASDVLGIRKRFDVEAILLPLALATAGPLLPDTIRRIRERREHLMYQTFYRYASAKAPKIDQHYITMALDQWSWYWVVLEATVLALVLATIFFFTKHQLAAILLFVALISIGILQNLRGHCVNYALQEVEQITADDSRRIEIAAVFRALQS